MIKNCPMRHEKGNCLPAGGFCTANKNICEALRNAYRMGKSQLSQEGTTKDATPDAISRQAAVELTMKYCPDDDGAVQCDGDIRELLDELENLQSVQPEQKWIPVSERLPENGRQVLVYARSTHFALAKYDEMREADGNYKKQWVTFDAWKPFYTVKNVIAWMELPEPYKVGRNE